MLSTRPPKLGRLLVLSGLALFLTSCSVIGIPDSPLDSLDPRGPFAERIDNLFWPVFWVATGVFILVEGAMVLSVFLFRDRPGRKDPRQIHGNNKLEIMWTIIPAVILASIAIPTVRAITDLTECGADAYPVQIIGHQWWFEYRYPLEEVVTATELVIPAGREVCATMTSEDVLHNYWIPALNGKRYLVPGQETSLRLEAYEPGVYMGQCAEFCGLSHSLMRARAVAMTEEEFSSWISSQQEPAPQPAEGSEAAAGLEVFLNRCTQCHTIDPFNVVALDQFSGPDLTHFMSRETIAGGALEYSPANLTRWLANPPQVKPGSFMPDLGLTQEEIDSLIALLETLE
ncbi:MAG TPA: cytochrome c oxidase subunit II [Acidimicrobiia bacterium]|nr:cytochrome c oxidase subunit II [Acidimicrobiia bacterium]